MINRLLVSIFCLFLVWTINAQTWMTTTPQEEELGHVKWLRSYDVAMGKAKIENKPIFILFQEVPGCSTCKNYGINILTHPHIVEAIETYFIPLAIHNNKGGKDADVLRKFGEPSWNNPVVRIIEANSEKDIIERLNGRYDMASLIGTLSKGILASNKLIPEYLNILQQEYSAKDLRETHLSMYCFWSGEKNLGNLNGVLSTKAGFMNGAEVVKVKYDAGILKETNLMSYAANHKCADGVFSNDKRELSAAKKLNIRTQKKGKFRADKQPKYYTYNSDYKYIPMTSLQALKVNTALSNRLSPEEYLSPRQLELLRLIKDKKIKVTKSMIDQDFALMWNEEVLKFGEI